MPPELPDFDRPPVGEMALGVQFQPLTEFRTRHLGLLWSKYRDRYPTVQEHAALPPQPPELPPGAAPTAGVLVEFGEVPPPPRCWFLNPEGTVLLQVQQNRFIQNWRQVAAGDHYPRYERLRASFEREIEVFTDFLDREGIGRLTPDQCEVTYVNHLPPGVGWERAGQADRVVTVLRAEYSDEFLREPEDVRFSERHAIRTPSCDFVGRLHITLEPVLRLPDRRPMLVLTLAARGRPQGSGLEGVLRFFDIGHEWIVAGFASITTPAMHALWGRRRA